MNKKASLNHRAMPAVMAFFAILLIIAIVALRPGSAAAPKQTSPTVARKGNQQPNNNLKVHTVIDVKFLEQQMQKTKSDRLYVDVYPVKQSTDINKKDFLLLPVVLNAKGQPVNGNRETNKEQIEKGAACYANFLHRNNIQAGTIPFGYQVTVDKRMLKGKTALDITVYLLNPVSNRAYMMGAQPQPLYSDSMPICKCPPGCVETNCLYEVELARITAKEFNQKTTSN